MTEETPIVGGATPRSLKELIDRVSGRHLRDVHPHEDSGIAEVIPFPFLAMVGQPEMKLALILALINPGVGGVLLVGPRGTGKTTAVRSLIDLLPEIPRSLCQYGCLPEDIETGGMDAVCPDCAQKFAMDEPLAVMNNVLLIELPLNAQLEDVIGGLDERVAHGHFRVRKGVLAQADRNLLYIDEVNLLPNDIIDAILDASAQGNYSVRRGPLAATYYSRFVLIGSMNPEEGQLRPQILDRFGLRIIVQGLETPEERLEAYKRVQAYRTNPRQTAEEYGLDIEIAREEIQLARDLLPKVTIPDDVAALGLEMIQKLKVASLRAEITLFESARAHAAADGREEVSVDDLKQVAAMALRLRRSVFMADYFSDRKSEESEIASLIETTLSGEK